MPVVPKQYLLPFIVTTCCFSLWGFANDFTNPLVKVFEQVFIIGTSQASWLQFAFYTGYFCMAIPAALFIRKYSYKAAIILGLTLYGVGALITIPASLTATFWVFCLASYVITYGLAFLETSCNPYILAMGPPETATQRLNLAQAFNPIGSLTGMAVATFLLAPALQVGEFRAELGQNNPAYTQYLISDSSKLPEGATLTGETVSLADGNTVTFYKNGVPTFADELPGALDGAVPDALKTLRFTEPDKFAALQQADLGFVRTPYMVIAGVVFTFLIIFSVSKLPLFKREEQDAPFFTVTGHLLKKAHFREGVLAQGFYVGAQIMCWTFIIHYGMEQVGLDLATAQKWNIAAMIIFLCSRFICTFLLRFISPGKLLFIFSLAGLGFTIGAIYLPGYTGLTCLVLISACMSLMFPTIYGIALKDLKEEETKLGSAYLIMAIVGGAVLTKLQGGLIESYGVRTSFWLPAACFVLIALFGYRTYQLHESKTA
ncbi:sugar MFS transporter [Pelagicoccus sp. SDUM812005]|uniref:sugar MFS transporter n=1 Tax=Pelagicoccus sp. SDUM812005 TaxID=3041257 RepID=UPI00280E7612|nr:sugar MFS transporter [Pelagicoccus sp. SDUM812005]MDQ8181165.1 sugar MFS transporter [Pelagicoccus sp. SDUM812005]